MDTVIAILGVAIGFLTLLAAIVAARYAKQTRDDSRAPRLALRHGDFSSFIISNAGRDVAKEILDTGNHFNSVPNELLPSIGSTYDPRQAINRSVTTAVTLRTPLDPEQSTTVRFEYMNSYGNRFLSEFTITNVQRQSGPHLADPFEVRERCWRRLR